MRKIIAMLLSLIIMLCPLIAVAEEANETAPSSTAPAKTFIMAGYDATSSRYDWNNNLFFRRMEERTGIAFTFQQYTDAALWTADKTALAQSASIPDVLFKAELTPAETQRLYEEGVLIDLRPYLEEYAPSLTALLNENPAWKDAVTLPDGAIVALPQLNELQNTNAIWINEKWLSILKLSMPTTAEELTEVLRAFQTGDPNRNGKSDEVPMVFTGMWDLRFLAHAFGIYSNDYHITAVNGQVKETLTSAQNRAFLEWLHLLWEERLIDHRGFSASDKTRQITDDSTDIPYGVVFGPSILNLLPTSALGSYTVLMPLQYDGQQVYRDLLGDVVRGTFAITSHCQDPAALLSWVDFLYTGEGCMLAEAGEKDSEYEVMSDGRWSWIADAQTVAQMVLPECTIGEGAPAPGYVPLSYQLNYDDDSTHRAVELLSGLQSVSQTPYPPVYLTDGQQSRIDALWAEIGPYSEQTMARFVTGDYTLDDASWQAFCDKLNEMGLAQTVEIWQEALR